MCASRTRQFPAGEKEKPPPPRDAGETWQCGGGANVEAALVAAVVAVVKCTARCNGRYKDTEGEEKITARACPLRTDTHCVTQTSVLRVRTHALLFAYSFVTPRSSGPPATGCLAAQDDAKE